MVIALGFNFGDVIFKVGVVFFVIGYILFTAGMILFYFVFSLTFIGLFNYQAVVLLYGGGKVDYPVKLEQKKSGRYRTA